MSQQQLMTVPDNAVAVGINQQIWDALTTSIYPGAKPESIIMVYQYCKARQLDPLKKPVHIVPMSVKNAVNGRYEYRDVIMPGIQELRTTASRTGLMAGTDAPVFGELMEVPVTDDPTVKDPVMLKAPESCTITVHRLDKTGVPRAYVHIEFFDEAVARTKDGAINSMWRKRSRGQLAKCAEAGALRKAFPEELGGVYAAEEMDGKVLGEGVVEGDFSVVAKGDEIPMPDEIDATEAQAQPAQEKPVETPAEKPAPEPSKRYAAKAAPKTEAKAVKQAEAPEPTKGDLKVELDAGPHRVLTSRLQTAGLTEDELLKGFGKSVSIGNINEVFTWIKEQQG